MKKNNNWIMALAFAARYMVITIGPGHHDVQLAIPFTSHGLIRENGKCG
jgi:hypothetical protein